MGIDEIFDVDLGFHIPNVCTNESTTFMAEPTIVTIDTVTKKIKGAPKGVLKLPIALEVVVFEYENGATSHYIDAITIFADCFLNLNPVERNKGCEDHVRNRSDNMYTLWCIWEHMLGGEKSVNWGYDKLNSTQVRGIRTDSYDHPNGPDVPVSEVIKSHVENYFALYSAISKRSPSCRTERLLLNLFKRYNNQKK